MITWDIEGEELPGATYVGDPRVAEQLAPELVGVIDQYFQRFRDAGLQVGVTIRPQEFDGVGQNEVNDPAALLIDKISYAKTHWGCRLFYIDSNDPTDDGTIVERVVRAFPDVLLFPEHKNTRYYASTAPYIELRRGFTSTPVSAQSVYPEAFSLINLSDSDLDAHSAALVAAVKRGDILMYLAWFKDPADAKIKALYDAAAQR
jgi:hypothetical protein